MTSLLVEAGPGTGKTTLLSLLTRYLRATNKDLFLLQERISDEQLAIIKWVEENILIDRVVNGTLTKVPIDNQTSIIGVTYNREAADQLGRRTHKTVECKTHHGWGAKVLKDKYGYIKLNSKRSEVIIEKLTGKSIRQSKEGFKWLAAARYLEKLKDELLDPTEPNLLYVASKYDDLAAFKPTPEMIGMIGQMIPLHKVPDRAVGIDFIDQVWLALFLLRRSIFDLAIVDEAQDQSAARLQLAEAIATHKIYVGDGDQSINYFSGADCYSIDKIKDRVDAILPLKLSFRCPPNVIRRLNNLKPKAKLRGLDKPEGEVRRVQLDEVASLVEAKNEKGETYGTNLMICRYNAPIIRVTLKLIAEGIPCRILGDRLVDQLCKTVDNRRATTLDELEDKLNKYEKVVCNGLEDYVKEQFVDKLNCIRLVIPLAESVEDVKTQLKRLMKPAGKDHVLCATIHKSKGMEAHNVWIMFPPIQSDKARTEEQKIQESNVEYVAESRTSCNSYYIMGG